MQTKPVIWYYFHFQMMTSLPVRGKKKKCCAGPTVWRNLWSESSINIFEREGHSWSNEIQRAKAIAPQTQPTTLVEGTIPPPAAAIAHKNTCVYRRPTWHWKEFLAQMLFQHSAVFWDMIILFSWFSWKRILTNELWVVKVDLKMDLKFEVLPLIGNKESRLSILFWVWAEFCKPVTWGT